MAPILCTLDKNNFGMIFVRLILSTLDNYDNIYSLKVGITSLHEVLTLEQAKMAHLDVPHVLGYKMPSF